MKSIFLSKYYIVYFRDTILVYLQKRIQTNFEFFFFTVILLLFNLFLIMFSAKDMIRIFSLNDVEEGSILYGLNHKQEYEPVAEYVRFAKTSIPLSEIEKKQNVYSKIIKTFLSTEDNEFYTHQGIYIKGIFRAFLVNFFAGKVKEGASTITQQVARLKFLNTERSFYRKIREAWIAFLLETFYSKEEILRSYLTEIPLGHGTLGVIAASKFYFGKEAKDLNWGESAILASLTTRPTQFSPLVNPLESREKVKTIFRNLLETGKVDLKTLEKEFEQLDEFYLTLNRSPNDSAFSNRLNRFPYFTEYVRRKMLRHLTSEQLYSGGLRIYSTLQIDHQISAEKALKEGLINQTQISRQRMFRDINVFDKELGSVYTLLSELMGLDDFKVKTPKLKRDFTKVYHEEIQSNLSALNLIVGSDFVGEVIEVNYENEKTEDYLLPVEGALISLRPMTGHITSIVGGSEFKPKNQQIRPFQAFRQVGSSVKPLLFSSLMESSAVQAKLDKKNGIEGKSYVTASSLYLDSPLKYLLEDGYEWNPGNYSSEYAGFIRLRVALEQSKNSVAIRAAEEWGLDKFYNFFVKLLNIPETRVPKNYSIALGSFELTPLELTEAYAAIASNGVEVIPISVLYVKDKNNKKIFDFEKEIQSIKKEQLISPETSFIMTSMMKDAVSKGTGKQALAYGLTGEVAGKTGTTNNFKDAWFAGFTPELVSVVWVGFDVGTLSLGQGMSGGSVAAPIWGKFMANALRRENRSQFSYHDLKVEKKTVCAMSGKLPGSKCTEFIEEYFIQYTTPKQVCEDHELLEESFSEIESSSNSSSNLDSYD